MLFMNVILCFFYTLECNLNILFALYRLALKKRLLYVLDFGGALGSIYRQYAQLLTPAIQDISWNIVEQKSFLEVAEKLNCETELHFHNSIEDVFMNCDIDAVLFSSVLQYINDYENIFEKVKHVNYIIVDRHPEFCDKDEARFTVQKVMEPIYNASYPLRIFGKKELENLFISRYTILEKWQYDSDIKQFFKSKDGKSHETHQIGILLENKNIKLG